MICSCKLRSSSATVPRILAEDTRFLYTEFIVSLHSKQHELHGSPLSPSPVGQHKSARWMLLTQWVVSQLRKLKLRGPHSFTTTASKPAQTLPQWKTSLLHQTTNQHFLCSRGRHYLYVPRLSSLQNPWNIVSAPLTKCSNKWETHVEWYPSRGFLLSSSKSKMTTLEGQKLTWFIKGQGQRNQNKKIGEEPNLLLEYRFWSDVLFALEKAVTRRKAYHLDSGNRILIMPVVN